MPNLSRQSTEKADRPAVDPHQVINSFFESYQIAECQNHIWNLLSAAFSSEDSDMWDAAQRGNAVFFCRNIDALIKAAFEINRLTKAD
jgi:hypothetical protein